MLGVLICRPNSPPPCGRRRTRSPSCLKGAAQAPRRAALCRLSQHCRREPDRGFGGALSRGRAVGGRGFLPRHGPCLRHAEPPRSPLLFQYGGSFADFIAGFAPAAPLPYLRDMARLEYAQGLAYHAADREPLPPASLRRPGSRAPCRLQGRAAPFGVHRRLALSGDLDLARQPGRDGHAPAPSRRRGGARRRDPSSMSRRGASSPAPTLSCRRCKRARASAKPLERGRRHRRASVPPRRSPP